MFKTILPTNQILIGHTQTQNCWAFSVNRDSFVEIEKRKNKHFEQKKKIKYNKHSLTNTLHTHTHYIHL